MSTDWEPIPVDSVNGREAVQMLREHVGDAAHIDEPTRIQPFTLQNAGGGIGLRIGTASGVTWCVYRNGAARHTPLPPDGSQADVTTYFDGQEREGALVGEASTDPEWRD